ncbi:MAG: threonine ammonia-lyase [Thermodesulfobacteriota bacterium]
MFTTQQFKEAGQRLKPVLAPTNLIYSDYYSQQLDAQVYLKPENLQRTGAFKLRGAYNKIASLSSAERAKGIVTASAGNHAQGVALAARLLCNTENSWCTRATIVMPEITPLIKVEATERLGARVILHGDNYDDAYQEARRLAEEESYVFVHPFDDPEVIIGQGTIGLEILDELPEVDVILVPVGGGGLYAGIIAAIQSVNPEVEVIGIEPEGAACMGESLRQGRVIELAEVDTIADGVAVKRAGDLPYQIIRDLGGRIERVSDTSIMEALLLLIEKQKLICEKAGACSLAGLSQIDLQGKRVVAVVSGGNIDVITIAEMLTRGLIARGRLFSFTVELYHKPGELLKISEILAASKANVVQLAHDQFHNPSRFKSVKLDVTVETNGSHHVAEIVKALEDRGYTIEPRHHLG